MVSPYCLTQAPCQVVAAAENVIEAHIPRDRAIVEKDIDVGSVGSWGCRILGVLAAKIVSAQRRELVVSHQPHFWFQIAAVRASRIDLAAADFVPLGIFGWFPFLVLPD